MSATINQCLAALKTLLEGASLGDAVYDYRTFPDKLTAEISLSYQGGNPARNNNNTTGGNLRFYDVTAVVRVQCALDGDGRVTETALRTAEQALNTLENGIYDLLGKAGSGYTNSYWLSVTFPTESRRPPSPTDAPTSRMAYIPFRLNLR